MLRKECQDMYNNYEMASTDLEAVNQKLQRAEITMNKLNEIESTKNVYCGYGLLLLM
jgi:chaperonin cofactor prefoldin